MNDYISRQAAIDVLDVLCQEHRYKMPGKRETYSQYNEAWQDALDRAEGAIFNLPSAQPEIIRCKDCKHFEYDHPYIIQGIPVLGHEVCNAWGDGCKTDENGYCFMAERRADG